MKFSLFAHMERLSATQNHQDLYQDFLSLCTLADEGGMRAIWTGEHHGMEFTIAPNPFITITDLARHTKNVKLGTGTIICLLYTSPSPRDQRGSRMPSSA